MEMGAPGEVDPAEAEEIVEDVPLAATDGFAELDGTGLSDLPDPGEEVEVKINLDALQEAVQQLEGEQELDFSEEELAAMLAEAKPSPGETVSAGVMSGKGGAGIETGELEAGEAEEEEDEPEGLGENESLDINLSDDLIDDIAEKLTVDMGATLSGWAGRSSESMKWELEKALAHRRSTDVEEELETLKKAHEELIFENKQLKESFKQYKQAFNGLKEGMHDVNLSNARLLYTNRVLRNTSLNERQKSKIADAISKAGSVTEAKTIYRTLESTVESTPKRGPQSLSEAIGRRATSVIRASRQESTSSDPHMDRMKRLAGIE